MNTSAEFLSRKLNPAQLRAVTTVTGPVLVNAGAGTGKTGVIEHRVCHLVRDLGVPPPQILLLTFTRRAAREMLTRAARHDPRCAQVEGGTFHSFGYRCLRNNAEVIGLSPNFTVLDASDAAELVGRCAARLGYRDLKERFPDKDTLHRVLSAATNRNRTISQILAADYPHFVSFCAEIECVGREYVNAKKQTATLDYDDLLSQTCLLLQTEELRRRIAGQYSHIMVDEYQDTNHLQAAIAQLLAKDHGNILVVGDDAQTIYSFRGSDHENIMRFPELWLHCEIVTLEENYRSSQSILDLANATLASMSRKYPKCLRSARDVQGEKPQMRVFRNEYDEAEWIAGRIKSGHDEGVTFCRQAALARAVYLLRPLELALVQRKIPYVVFGGLAFTETAHVKDLMALLRIVANPKDQLAWMRALKMIRGIGTKRADQLGCEFAGADTLLDACARMGTFAQGTYAYSEGLKRLEQTLRETGRFASDAKSSYDIVLEFYRAHISNLYDDYPDRLEDLEVIGQMLGSFENLEVFLAQMAIESPHRADRRTRGRDAEDDVVTLSTIHSAKGMEWEHVFLLGVKEGALPSSRAHGREQIEEEHRLFYVAVTRAMAGLFLSMNMVMHDKTGIPRLSRFLDLPDVKSLVERVAS